MREGWDLRPLGDMAVQRIEPLEVQAHETYTSLGVKWYAAGTFAREPKLGRDIKAKRLFRVRPGQFVYNRLFATEGSFALIRAEDAHAVVSNEFPVFDVDNSRLLPEYLFLHFQQRAIWERVSTECVGTTRSRSRWKEERFLAHTLRVPPLHEQRRIVELVDAVDVAIEASDTAAAAVAAVRRSICAAAQLQADERLLADLAEVSQGKSLPLSIQGERSGDIPWFKIADMARRHNAFGYTAAETSLDEEHLLAHGGRIVEPGAVVFPRVGAAVRTEKKRLMTVAGAVDENHLVLTPKPGVSSEVLLAVMETFSLTRLSQSGAVPSLNMGVVRAAKVRWPSGGQGPLGEALGASRISAALQAAATGGLRHLRSNLLTALLSGEHEVPVSYDEPLAG